MPGPRPRLLEAAPKPPYQALNGGESAAENE